MQHELPEWIRDPRPEIYDSDRYIAVDLETTTLEHGSALNNHNHLILACWQDGKTGQMYSHRGEEWEQHSLMTAVKAADFIVAHNAKFELQWLARCGLDLHDVIVYDTMIGEWVRAGNRPWAFSLEESLKRYQLEGKEHVVSKMIRKHKIDCYDIPKKWLLDYCMQDVVVTDKLFKLQWAALKEDGLTHIQYSRCLLTPVLADIEPVGLTLDKDAVYEEWKDVSNKLAEVGEQLEEYGTINWNSGKQVGALLYDRLGFAELTNRRGEVQRTASGARKTDQDTLLALKATNKRQRAFVTLLKKQSQYSSRLSKSLTFFKEIVDNHDCTFQGSFNQCRARTHRLSSSGRAVAIKGSKKTAGAQLQNLPREYKRLFVAKDKANAIIEADGSQLEFRVAVELGKDKIGYQEIVDGVDIHMNTFNALIAGGYNIPSRTEAKPYTFKPLYAGQGAPNTPERTYCEFFQKKYHQITEEQTRWTFDVLRDKVLTTAFGMKYYWPHVRMNEKGRVLPDTEIFNYPIQGSATAEIIPLVVVLVWHLLRNLQTKLLSTIHDSVLLESPKEEHDEVVELLGWAFTLGVYEMLERLYKYKMTTPLASEIKIGERWGQGESVVCKAFRGGELVWNKKE